MNRTLTVFLLAFAIIIAFSIATFADSMDDELDDFTSQNDYTYIVFSDVIESAYYYDAVNWAVTEGITNGTSSTTFSPNDACTRGQVATFLWRALGSPEPVITENPFTDIKDADYHYKAILWAYENGITTGTTETTFAPSIECTSAQIITFLWRAMGKPEADVFDLPVAEQDTYYSEAVAWAKENGLLDYSDTPFDAISASPRADIVTYLYYVLT